VSANLRQICLHMIHRCRKDLQLLVHPIQLKNWVGASVKHSLRDAVLEDEAKHIVAKFLVMAPLDLGELLEDLQLLKGGIQEVSIGLKGVHYRPSRLRGKALCPMGSLENRFEQLCDQGPTLGLACVAGELTPNFAQGLFIEQVGLHNEELVEHHLKL
jgi:hypothetical protein